jgi:cell division protease FtsH
VSAEPRAAKFAQQEYSVAPKRGPNQRGGQRGGRGRSWFSNSTLLVTGVIVTAIAWYVLNRGPDYANLKYGELIQILEVSRHDPSIMVQKVQVGHSDIRGEIATTNSVTDGKTNDKVTQHIPFRTMRLGLENDQGLHALLKETVPGYQGEEEESTLRNLVPYLIPLLIVMAGIIGLFIALRWMAGDSSPLTFGRSKAKLYAQKDLEITFKDVAGIDEAVAELREVVDFLKTPDKYQALGGRIP